MFIFYLPPTATPVVTAITPSPLITLENVSITLSFEVNYDIPPVTLTSSDWMVTNSEGSSNIPPEVPRFTFNENFTSLTINPVYVADEGTYTLTATNEAGSHNASIIVDVQCKIYMYSQVHFCIYDIYL